MKKILNIIPFFVFSISAALLAGCVTPPPVAPQTTQIKCRIPKIEVIADKVNTETQSKGGLDITVVPALYKGVRVDKTTTTQIQPNALVTILVNPKDRVFVEQVTTSQLKPQPARLEFTVKIHNQLNRVFHGQGAVVQFNVDGQLIPFNNTDYKQFSGGIVPPLYDGDLQIDGPPLDMLKDKGTISIFLYDVVTATDVAGNTTEKQNYTWDFSYTMQEVTENGVMKKDDHYISVAEYNQILMQQQMQLQRQAQENQAQ